MGSEIELSDDERAVFNVIYAAVTARAFTPNVEAIRRGSAIGVKRADDAFKSLIRKGIILAHGYPRRTFSIPGVDGETVLRTVVGIGEVSEEKLKEQNRKFIAALRKFYARRARLMEDVA